MKKNPVPRMTTEQCLLVEKNHSLIFSVLNKCHLPVDEYYDIAAIGLCYAAIAYNPGKGCFSTYAYQCIYHEICKQMKAGKRAKRSGDKPTLSCDFSYKEGLDDKDSTVMDFLSAPDNVEDQCIYAEMLSSLFKKLPPIQRKVLALFHEGYNQAEIAERIGCSKQYVSVLRSKIAKKAEFYLR